MQEIWQIVLPLISAIITAPISAWLMAKLLKSKHEAEIAKLKTEVDQMRSDVRSRELDNDRKAIAILMELVVEPLRVDMTSLQNTVKRLTNAINKIPYCPYSDDCIVARELQNSATDDCTGSTISTRKRKGTRATNSQPAAADESVAISSGSTEDGSKSPHGK